MYVYVLHWKESTFISCVLLCVHLNRSQITYRKSANCFLKWVFYFPHLNLNKDRSQRRGMVELKRAKLVCKSLFAFQLLSVIIFIFVINSIIFSSISQEFCQCCQYLKILFFLLTQWYIQKQCKKKRENIRVNRRCRYGNQLGGRQWFHQQYNNLIIHLLPYLTYVKVVNSINAKRLVGDSVKLFPRNTTKYITKFTVMFATLPCNRRIRMKICLRNMVSQKHNREWFTHWTSYAVSNRPQ